MSCCGGRIKAALRGFVKPKKEVKKVEEVTENVPPPPEPEVKPDNSTPGAYYGNPVPTNEENK